MQHLYRQLLLCKDQRYSEVIENDNQFDYILAILIYVFYVKEIVQLFLYKMSTHKTACTRIRRTKNATHYFMFSGFSSNVFTDILQNIVLAAAVHTFLSF